MDGYSKNGKEIVIGKDTLLYYNDHVLHSRVYTNEPFRNSLYLITTVSCLIHNARKILVLGAGLGSAVFQIKKMIPESEITVVDIDEEVFVLWDRYFDNANTRGIKRIVANAIEFIKSDDQLYDYIMVDLAIGGMISKSFADIVFFHNIYSRLSPTGIMAFNTSMRDFYFLDKTFDSKENPLQYIYENMFKAGFKEIVKIDFSYAGWIHCYKGNKTLCSIHDKMMNKSTYIAYAIKVQKFFSHTVLPKANRCFILENDDLIAEYRNYLFSLILGIKRNKVMAHHLFNDGREDFINLYLKYIKKEITPTRIKNIIQNLFVCNDPNYFCELNELIKYTKLSFESISNFVMLPSHDLCEKVRNIMDEQAIYLFGKYQYDEI